MQGYQRPTLKLIWPADSEFHGLEVRVRRLSIGNMLEIADLEQGLTDQNATTRLAALIAKMAKMLLSWNLLDAEEQPVTADETGLRTVDPEMLYAIINAATTAMVGVAPPLPQPSADGGQSLEASIPMETLSPSLETSETLD
jgi:hypothetical protein